MAKMDEALSNIFRSICKKKPAGVRKKEMMDILELENTKEEENRMQRKTNERTDIAEEKAMLACKKLHKSLSVLQTWRRRRTTRC